MFNRIANYFISRWLHGCHVTASTITMWNRQGTVYRVHRGNRCVALLDGSDVPSTFHDALEARKDELRLGRALSAAIYAQIDAHEGEECRVQVVCAGAPAMPHSINLRALSKAVYQDLTK